MALQLPSHLQGRVAPDVTSKAVAGMGVTLPPRISIGGNAFTLIDAAGKEYPAGTVLDIAIVDSSDDPPRKRFYREKWQSDSNDPPLCFSSNGIAPSIESVERQARTCAECQFNKRGSAVSEISGVAIKACRDEKWLAVLLPSHPSMLFQLVLTPGSFGNWKNFTKYFGKGVNITDVVTHLSFEAKKSGVLCFEIAGYAQNNPQFISEPVLRFMEKAWAEKATEALIGKTEQIALPAPATQNLLAQAAAEPFASGLPEPQPLQMTPPPQGQAPIQATSQPTQQRRRRNTAAAPAPQHQEAPFMPGAQGPAPVAPTTGLNGPANFGIQQGAEPAQDIQNTLNSLFGS